MKIELRHVIKIDRWKLAYYLISEKNDIGYGIQIVQTIGEKVVESKTLKNLPIKKREIEGLCRHLAKEGVFPSSLYDVVEDWLREPALRI